MSIPLTWGLMEFFENKIHLVAIGKRHEIPKVKVVIEKAQ
jgi:hypothetical protein